jgi:hypothetical protein
VVDVEELDTSCEVFAGALVSRWLREKLRVPSNDVDELEEAFDGAKGFEIEAFAEGMHGATGKGFLNGAGVVEVLTIEREALLLLLTGLEPFVMIPSCPFMR